jgi:hypothetical protein
MRLTESQKNALKLERARYKGIAEGNPSNPYDLLAAKIMLEQINLIVILHNAA